MKKLPHQFGRKISDVCDDNKNLIFLKFSSFYKLSNSKERVEEDFSETTEAIGTSFFFSNKIL